MRPLVLGRALTGILVASLLSVAACSKPADDARNRAETRASARSQSRPVTAAQDPNAENPDRDRWVDLASEPFHPEWVGGRVVQIRATLAQSLNAVRRVGRSADVERMHKYLLGAPLLMEVPDRGPDGFEVRPHGARTMPEDSPDHLTQVWTLRQDLTWEDGQPVTAKDYVFTLRMIRDPAVESAIRDAYRLVESLEEVDKFRFRVTWTKPNYRAINTIGLDLQVVPAHALPTDPVSFNKATTHLACGPYRIASFEPATKIEMVLRDEYRAKPFPIRPSYVERFVYEGGVRDPTSALMRLENGDAHIVNLSGDQYAVQGAGSSFQRAAWRTHFFMPSYSYIAWNLKDPADVSRPHPVLADVRVRRALSHLLPLESIAAATYHGLARPVSAPLDFRDPGYDGRVAPFAFDPAKASALLKEAGWGPAPAGLLVKEGRPLKLTLARYGPLFAVVSQAFQEEARKVGVQIELADRPTLVSEDLPNHKFDAGILLWLLDPVEPDLSAQFHSRFAQTGGANYSGFADPEVDRLLDRIEVSFDPKERSALRRKIHGCLHEEVPCTFLLANASTVGLSRKLANVKVHDLGIRFHDLILRR